MTLQLFNQNEIFQITLTSFVEGFHAKHFRWQGLKKDLMTHEELSFLKSQGFSDITEKTKSQSLVFYSKMLKAYLCTTMEEHLLQFTEFLPTLVIPLNANFLILATSPSHKTGKGSLLQDILETEVDPKYFLSETAVQKLERYKKKGAVSIHEQ